MGKFTILGVEPGPERRPMLQTARFTVPLDNPRREAFCQALAGGATVAEAGREAGFTWRGHAMRIMDKPDIVGRTAAIRLRLAGGGSRDISAIIDGLLETALEARTGCDPKAAMTARAAYETAAKFKLQLPADPKPTAAAPVLKNPIDQRLTDAEWMARFGPEPPGGKTDWNPSEGDA
ncbi:MAG TPA: hypothetical protein VGS12_11055 [Caulobacteraceae bacterium]|nr:hypothetical protein [Caulobacteraceae bacterium]